MSEYNVVLCRKCLRPCFGDPCPYCELAALREAVRELGAVVRKAERFVREDGRGDPPARYREMKAAIEKITNPIAAAAVRGTDTP